MASIDDSDVPETGAVFTFGRSRFADNLANKFWIRNDKIVEVACGDEHSIAVTERGRLYAFGTNDWGQLGLGHTHCSNKPSFIKALKGEKVVLASCGRTHTIAASESGKVFSFGAGGDGQLGHGNTEDQYLPKQIAGLPLEKVKMLSCGVYHSAVLYESGHLFIWGTSGDGQTGLDEEEVLRPQLLSLDDKVSWVACGYYHTAVVTDSGKLYTFGENENGKLGLKEEQLKDTSRPQPVATKDGFFIAVACGSGHTIALTKEGKVFSFGDGSRGQLGQGTRVQELKEPGLIQQLSQLKVRSVSCGDCHSAVVTDNGRLYTFGDGRHGKLGQGEECFSNQFRPSKVSRFQNFHVESVSCGGCHTLVTAVQRESQASDDEDEEDGLLNASMASSFTHFSMDEANATMRPFGLSNTVPLISPRDKRRQKESETLANSFSGSLSKNGTPLLSKSLDRSRLPQIPNLSGFKEKKIEQKEVMNEESLPPEKHHATKENGVSNKVKSDNAKNRNMDKNGIQKKQEAQVEIENNKLLKSEKQEKQDKKKQPESEEEDSDEDDEEESEYETEEEDKENLTKEKDRISKQPENKKSVRIATQDKKKEEEEEDEDDEDDDEEDSEEGSEEETEDDEPIAKKETTGKESTKKIVADTSKKKESNDAKKKPAKKLVVEGEEEDEEEDDDEEDDSEEDDSEDEEKKTEKGADVEDDEDEDDEGEDDEDDEDEDGEDEEVEKEDKNAKEKKKNSDKKIKETGNKKSEDEEGKETKKNDTGEENVKQEVDKNGKKEVNNNEKDIGNTEKKETQPAKVSKFANLFGKKKKEQPKNEQKNEQEENEKKVEEKTGEKTDEKQEAPSEDQTDGPANIDTKKETPAKKTGKSGVCVIL